MSVNANNNLVLKELKKIQQTLALSCNKLSPSFSETAKKVEICGERIEHLERNLKNMTSSDAARELSSLEKELSFQATLFQATLPFHLQKSVQKAQVLESRINIGTSTVAKMWPVMIALDPLLPALGIGSAALGIYAVEKLKKETAECLRINEVLERVTDLEDRVRDLNLEPEQPRGFFSRLFGG